ncbi:hypothetical protein DL95DRAFT_457088 [Leptodontidium sp. 2 PMI_412]|nr:hypothetical protein DL95DRAFT_457088 [Leptodontidium sp. 2 PMI_412]
MQKFILEEANWAYTAEEMNQMWDFSNLRSLSICPSKYKESHLNIPIQNLSRLRTIKLDYKLSVRLRKLRLTNHAKIIFLNPMSSSLRKDIMRACPSIVDLTADIPSSCEHSARDISDFLLELTGARELKDLTLYATDILPVDGVENDSIDPEYDGVAIIMKRLHEQKMGHPYNKIKIHLHDWSKRPPSSTDEDYDRFEDHLYEQWGSLRRTAKWPSLQLPHLSSYPSSSEDEDAHCHWAYFDEAAAHDDDEDEDEDGDGDD